MLWNMPRAWSKIVSAATLTIDLTAGGRILYILLFMNPAIVDCYNDLLSPFYAINTEPPSKSALKPPSDLKRTPIFLDTV